MGTEESVSDVNKIWDETWNEIEKTEPEAEEETEEEVVAPEGASDENTETEEVEETDESEEQESVEDALEPPKHWSDADKKVFSELDEKGREFLLRRHKEMEADYTRKTQDIAPVRKALEPLRGELERAGLTEAQGIKALSDFYTNTMPAYKTYAPLIQQFEADPAGTIKKLAAQYKVSLDSSVAESDYTDPDINALKEQITGLESKLSQYEQSGQNEKIAEANRQIEAFKSETDEQGNPRHPHFEELESRIVSLLQTPGAISGTNPSERLKAAYEQAVWTVSEYRTALLEQQAREREEVDKTKRKEAAKKAKKAAGPATGKSVPGAVEHKTLRDDLSAELEKIGIR